MKTLTVLLLVFSSLFLLNSQQTTPQQVWVQGVVTDYLTGAPVPRATIVFETSTGGTVSVWSAKDGTYFALVPIGVYRVAVQRMTYCSVRRAAANIRAHTRFDFTLPPCAVEHVGIHANGRYEGEEAREVNPFKYEAFKLRSEILVRFGNKQDDERFIEYRGAKFKHLVQDHNSNEVKDEYIYMGVMLTHELLTVYADKVKLAKESFEIEAEGNVIVDDGSKRTKTNAIKIKLQ